ncbi:hypothetical protein [Bacillus cereus]|uniref:hypothetical protein n=1 Tax=Bacillus cereus TaxID=1396 RepID=UPI000BFD0ADC|nr:hypothetical protein [Bacillus cereus]PGY17731.1 hypothetical protein COE23_05835 [Bacillus cereus]
MEAKITVTLEEAIQVMRKANLVEGKSYEYNDLKYILKYYFPCINDNQVSGLVTRLSSSDKAIFIVDKQLGSRNKYIYSFNGNHKILETKMEYNNLNTKQSGFTDATAGKYGRVYQEVDDDAKDDKVKAYIAGGMLIISLIVGFFFGWLWAVTLFFIGSIAINKID